MSAPVLASVSLTPLLAEGSFGWIIVAAIVVGLIIAVWLALGLRYISNEAVGIVEKLWSSTGSLKEGRIIATEGQAGYQAKMLRGGIHLGYWPWQYSVHSARLVTVPQGKLAYVVARDGDPLAPGQTLGRAVDCNHFQDAQAFLATGGQRGRQRAILREGVYAINTSLFTVITEDAVYSPPGASRAELAQVFAWQQELVQSKGFDPVIIGTMEIVENNQRRMADTVGVVTVQDGPVLPSGEIIAPPVDTATFQDPEAFLAAGGRRGRQYPVLTDGTYFVNRWFATIEAQSKTVVPIGYVGVVVSYTGKVGKDVSGTGFRHGERVAQGERGVWETALGPGKYAFNTYAGRVVMVPTTNFVLHWITGRSESHKFDEDLKSIDLVTRDAYEPTLPLSVVVHIDYQRAPNVIQRFGDVQRLITQTLDPMLSAYFRDVAHTKTMLELLQHRDAIQNEARAWMREKFHGFDIECVDVMIGKPEPSGRAASDQKIENLLEQLRLRQLSIEQLETYERQRTAAEKRRTLEEAQAIAAKQAELTNSSVQVQIRTNQAEAELANAKKLAEQTVVVAEGELERSRREAERTVLLAKAERDRQSLLGEGEGAQARAVGQAQAEVLRAKVASYGDPRLYALSIVAEHLSRSQQPLVPERVVTTGGGAGGQGGLVDTLLSLLAAEKAGAVVEDAKAS